MGLRMGCSRVSLVVSKIERPFPVEARSLSRFPSRATDSRNKRRQCLEEEIEKVETAESIVEAHFEFRGEEKSVLEKFGKSDRSVSFSFERGGKRANTVGVGSCRKWSKQFQIVPKFRRYVFTTRKQNERTTNANNRSSKLKF